MTAENRPGEGGSDTAGDDAQHTPLDADAGHEHDAACRDPETDRKTAVCRAREKARAEREAFREEATAAQLAHLSRLYLPVADYKGPGSPEFDTAVERRIDTAVRLLANTPLPPHTFEDFNLAPALATGQDLVRLRGAAAKTLAAHDEHHAGKGQHPYCSACDPHHEGKARVLLRLTGWDARRRGPVPSATGEPVRTRSAFLSLDDLAALPPASWSISEVLPAGSVGYLTGRDGTYKTFLALDFGLHFVFMRDTWNGREVDLEDRAGRGGLLFVASEGFRSMYPRVAAWQAHHGLPPLETWRKGDLSFHEGAVDLYAGGAGFEALLDTAERMKPALIVIDTLNRCAGAADQNSASDMSVITARVAMLQRAGGPLCTVLVIAHTDKGDNDARGSSAIEDDADFVLHCKADADRLTVTVAKMKDGRSGQELSMRVLLVPEPDSLVVVEAKPEPQWASDSLDERIRGVLFHVRDLDHQTGAQLFALVKDDGTGKPASKSALFRALGDLVRAGVVVAEAVGVTKRYRLSPAAYPPDVRP